MAKPTTLVLYCRAVIRQAYWRTPRTPVGPPYQSSSVTSTTFNASSYVKCTSSPSSEYLANAGRVLRNDCDFLLGFRRNVPERTGGLHLEAIVPNAAFPEEGDHHGMGQTEARRTRRSRILADCTGEQRSDLVLAAAGGIRFVRFGIVGVTEVEVGDAIHASITPGGCLSPSEKLPSHSVQMW